jgi:hypothetical protein
MNPVESDRVTTLPPSSLSFWTVNCATLPLPDTRHSLPSIVSRRVASISAAKYTAP